MELEFHKYDGSTAALNPRIERRGEQFAMKLDECNCDYFILFCRSPSGRVDLKDKSIQNALEKKKDLFPEVKDEFLMENVMFSCIKWRDYRANDYAMDLYDRIGEYTVIGCKEESDRMIIFVPDESVSCTARVLLTVSYRISEKVVRASQHLFGRRVQPQNVYVVEFFPISNYQDGGIVYNLKDMPWNYPITRKMIEKGRFYIDAGCGEPRFSATVSGLELKQL